MSTTAPIDLVSLSHLAITAHKPVNVLAKAMRELRIQPAVSMNGTPWLSSEQAQQIVAATEGKRA